MTSSTPRRARQPADDPGFTSIVDNPPELVRTGRRHGPGLIILGNHSPLSLSLYIYNRRAKAHADAEMLTAATATQPSSQ